MNQLLTFLSEENVIFGISENKKIVFIENIISKRCFSVNLKTKAINLLSEIKTDKRLQISAKRFNKIMKKTFNDRPIR